MIPRKHFRRFCFALIVFSCVWLAYQAYKEANAQKTAREAREAFEAAQAVAKPIPTEPAYTPIPDATFTPTPTPKVIQPEFQQLRAEYNNNDIVGYLKIDGTSIDYPITHFKDNEYYLTVDINKNPSDAGWLYMDYENSVERQDLNTIIYGHNMRQDIMFHSLRFFQDEAYFKEHRYITFNTLYENNVWEIFSFYSTTVDFRYIQVFFESREDF
ncbi:MAG: class B sortase, partial [Clostridiales bacterium]|nr:class B sortase [Clostridiales bacterium]